MANISMRFYQDLNCAREGQVDSVIPVNITSLTKAHAPGEMVDATDSFGTIAADLDYEVFCPNCARVEIASARNMFKHKCNCGYGVYVEMLRTSPN